MRPPSGVPAPSDCEQAIVIYSTRWCGYCRSALRLLERRGVPFAEVDVTGNQEARAWLRQVTGRHTVPQIFIHGVPIGGYTDLAALDRDNALPGA